MNFSTRPPGDSPSRLPNLFTVDLEDWFCSHNLARAVPRGDWSRLENRVAAPTFRLLDLLDRHRVRAVFFVLGWTAERCPELVRHIAWRGHEIASHGYGHRQLTKISPTEFEDDLLHSLEILEPLIAGRPIRGYRAPAFSVTHRSIWALPILEKHGFEYDSSIFPTGMNPDYGITDAPLLPFNFSKNLLEIPLSVAQFFGKNVPCSGGGYLRQLPYPIFRGWARRCNAAGRPLIFYIHPWELDPDFPKISKNLSPLARWRHYSNLGTTEQKIERLLSDFEFGSIDDFLQRDRVEQASPSLVESI